MLTKKKIKHYYRLMRRLKFRTIRLIVFAFFRLWIKDIAGFEKIPQDRPAILVANHLSYYDFLVLGALFRRQIVFIAVKKIKQTFLIRWLAKLHIVIYINRDHPGITFFRDIMRYLALGRLVVIYPEGTRSRTGKMLKPKAGFVKLAIKANIPIIPIGIKGTYRILPPHRYIPRLARCKVVAGKKMYVSPSNPEFEDIFFGNRENPKLGKLTKNQMQKISIRIMDKVRLLAGEEWDCRYIKEAKKALEKEKAGFEAVVD